MFPVTRFITLLSFIFFLHFQLCYCFIILSIFFKKKNFTSMNGLMAEFQIVFRMTRTYLFNTMKIYIIFSCKSAEYAILKLWLMNTTIPFGEMIGDYLPLEDVRNLREVNWYFKQQIEDYLRTWNINSFQLWFIYNRRFLKHFNRVVATADGFFLYFLDVSDEIFSHSWPFSDLPTI